LTRGGSGATRHPWSRFLFKDRLVFKTLPPTIKLIEPFLFTLRGRCLSCIAFFTIKEKAGP
jgi:hypothetical protein